MTMATGKHSTETSGEELGFVGQSDIDESSFVARSIAF